MTLLFFVVILFLLFLARYNFFRIPKKGILVLLYHRIDDRPTGTSLDKFSISLARFEKQIAYLKKKGYKCAHPGNIEQIVAQKLYLKNKYVMFTFDDGYKDNVDAAEVLKKYGYSGLFFIATAYIGSKLDGVQMMNHDDLKKLVNMGMFLGSHSHEHIKLSKLDKDKIRKQVEQSLDILSKYQPIEDFAYPFGDVSDKVVEVLNKLGFKRAYIIGQKVYQPEIHYKLIIPRAIVRKDTNKIDFYLIITRGRSKF